MAPVEIFLDDRFINEIPESGGSYEFHAGEATPASTVVYNEGRIFVTVKGHEREVVLPVGQSVSYVVHEKDKEGLNYLWKEKEVFIKHIMKLVHR
jgi:hypothetical protein